MKAEQMRKECFPASGFYRDCTFEADDGKTPNTSSLCERYAATFDPKDPYGLLLLGDVGTGKSYMSSAIANRVIDLGFSAFQTDVRYIVNLMEESFDKRQSKLDRVLSYDLLLIEDLGAQRNTSYMMEQVYTIIDGRYKSASPWSSPRTSTRGESTTRPAMRLGNASSTASWSAAIPSSSTARTVAPQRRWRCARPCASASACDILVTALCGWPGRTPNRSPPSSLPLLPDSFLWGEETPGAFSTPGVSFCFRHIDSLIACDNAMNVV